MTAIESVVVAGQRLPASILDQSGEVLYSGSQTLRRGPVYLLGLNPGGNPNDHKETVRDRLKELPSRRWNNYQVSWAGRKPGAHRLQRGVQWVADELGLRVEDICASNLIFVRSKDERGSGFPDSARECWPVHRAILAVVRPTLVITFGNSPYNFLKDELGAVSESDPCPAGHANWQCRAFQANGMRVVGLPHMSVYAIYKHPKVGKWLRRLMNGR
jgi:hypothetical protein